MVLTALLSTAGLICIHMAFVTDADVWWQMRAGQWILSHHAFPHVDPFSIGGSNKPWEAYSWLFDVVLLKLFQQWGLAGFLVYSTALVVAITVALYRVLNRLQPNGTTSAVLVFLAMSCLTRLFTPRPWLITVLFFILELDILLHVRRSGKPRSLLLLPVLFLLWANLHVQFIDGLVLLLIAAAEPLLERWWPYRATRLRAGTMGLVVAGCIAATLVNPYGWRIYETAYELASQKLVLTSVEEMGAIAFRAPVDFLTLFLALGAAGALAWSHRFPIFESGLLIAGAVISFRSQRDIWFVVVVACVILASFLPSQKQASTRMPSLAMPLVLLVTCGVFFVGARLFGVNSATLERKLEENLPVKAVDAIRAGGYKGPIFNDYGWGGYLIWYLPEMPPSIDGRAALQGDRQLAQSAITWEAEPGWSTDKDLMAANVVLAPIHLPLAQLLRLDPQFELKYEDRVAVVFIRKQTGISHGK